MRKLEKNTNVNDVIGIYGILFCDQNRKSQNSYLIIYVIYLLFCWYSGSCQVLISCLHHDTNICLS